MNYEQEFEKLHAKFQMAWTLYFASCERLLSPLAMPEQDLRLLVEHPTSDKWKDPILEKKLDERLGTSHLPYKAAIKMLHLKVAELGKRLKLDDQFLVSNCSAFFFHSY